MNKKTLFKKLTALAAAVTMIMGTVGTTALAYAPDVNQKASISVHKFSRTTPGTGENPTGEEVTDTSGLGTPLAGAGFTLYSVTLPTLDAGETLTGAYTVDITNSKVVFTTSTGTKEGTIGTAVGTEQTTDHTGLASFATLDHGHYLLVETTTPAGYEKAADSMISLPMTKADGTGFNYDVHVYPKNVSDVPITKILDGVDKTYKVGDEANFTINAGISNKEAAPDTVDGPADLKDGTTYGSMKIMDTLVAGLEYKSHTISFLTANNTKVDLVEGTDYTLTGTATGELVWELTPAGIDNAIAVGAHTVEVKLTTTVKASVEALTNKASSSVKNAKATTEPEEPETPAVVVPTGNVVIDKIDAADDSALAGAVFVIATNEAATEFLKADGTTKTITDYTLLAADTEIVKGTTDADGKMIFSGLAYDKLNGSTYRVVEVQAPAGYQLKEAAIVADLTANSTELNVVTSVQVKNYANGTVDPENPKFALPLTGGTGTLLFTLAGLLIMGTVTGIYIRSKRKEKATK